MMDGDEVEGPVEDENNEELEPELAGLHAGRKGGLLRALVLTPTRELAMQIKAHIQVVIVLENQD